MREWDRSGLTAKEFAGPRGIRAETLRTWGRELRGPLPPPGRSQKRPVTRRPRFVEVRAAARAVAAADHRAPPVEIVLKNGRRLALFGELSAKRLAELAAALEAI